MSLPTDKLPPEIEERIAETKEAILMGMGSPYAYVDPTEDLRALVRPLVEEREDFARKFDMQSAELEGCDRLAEEIDGWKDTVKASEDKADRLAEENARLRAAHAIAVATMDQAADQAAEAHKRAEAAEAKLAEAALKKEKA